MQNRHCSPLCFDFARKVLFSENTSVRENFCQKMAEASSAKPLIVEDHDDAGALHCRRRAGPGRQHHLAVRVAALLTRPGLQAVELDSKAVAVLSALP